MRRRTILYFLLAVSVFIHLGVYHTIKSFFIKDSIEIEIIDCDYPVKELRPKHCL